MAIIGTILVSHHGAFEIDKAEFTLEWLVFSDNIRHFAQAIALQGTIAPDENMIGPNGEAKGWYAPGVPYRLGDEWHSTCYAGNLEIAERTIIKGDGNFEISVDDVNGIRFTIKSNGNKLIKYRARLTFSTDYQKATAPDGMPSEEDKVTIDVSHEYEDVPFVKDAVNGRPVVNSAGMLFNPATSLRRKIPVYSITRREIANPIHKANWFSNAVNDAPYYGALPGTLLMDSIDAKFDGNAWNVTYRLKEKYEGWHTDLLDTGYYARDYSGKLFAIEMEDGTPISEPAKLNGMGGLLPNQSLPGVNVGPFHKYHGMPFDALRLPNPFAINTTPSLYDRH